MEPGHEPARGDILMDGFIAVAKVADVPPGGRKRIEFNGGRVSLFHIDDEYYAILDTCPHKSTAPLIRGTLDGLGIKCPNHGYRFDLQTGECNISAQFNTQVYSVKIEGGDICIRPEKKLE